MQVILLDKIGNLGSLGDTVNVKSGYARNFLIPQGKAVMATKANVAMFESRRAELEAKVAEQLAAAQTRADQVNALEAVVIASKAGDEGKLFGSIGTRDIAMQSLQLALKYLRAKFAYLKVLCATLVLTKLAFNFTLKCSQLQKYKLLLSNLSY